jgi:hypothetical protein
MNTVRKVAPMNMTPYFKGALDLRVEIDRLDKTDAYRLAVETIIGGTLDQPALWGAASEIGHPPSRLEAGVRDCPFRRQHTDSEVRMRPVRPEVHHALPADRREFQRVGAAQMEVDGVFKSAGRRGEAERRVDAWSGRNRRAAERGEKNFVAGLRQKPTAIPAPAARASASDAVVSLIVTLRLSTQTLRRRHLAL